MAVIEDDKHVTRYCKPTSIVGNRPDGTAFRLREDIREEYLSCDCLERLPGREEAERMSNLIADYPLKTSKNGCFAVHNVGELRAGVFRDSPRKARLSVEEIYMEDRPSYCGIHGLQFDDDVVSDLMAELVMRTYSP